MASARPRSFAPSWAWSPPPPVRFVSMTVSSRMRNLTSAHARASAMCPRGAKLLILDEPTEGIQPSIIKDIERAIRTLAETGELAILLVEQYYDFARSLADQYLVMERGEILARGAGADMDRDGVRKLLAV